MLAGLLSVGWVSVGLWIGQVGAAERWEAPGSSATQALIWNGFEQQWGYNHRVNRLADYVGALSCGAESCVAPVVHAAASGSGSDQADYRSQVVHVTAPGVGFVQGASRFEVRAEHGEGQLLHYRTTEIVPAEALLSGRSQLHAVLGGFDLHARRDPDKLSRLNVEVGSPRYVDQGGQPGIAFEVDLALQMDCDSAECDPFDRGVYYDVSVMWTLIAADTELQVSQGSADHRYTWDRARARELDMGSARQEVQIAAEEGAPTFAAFRALSVALDDDHHFQGWSTALAGLIVEHGLARVGVDLLFRQWNLAGRSRALSFADRGSAALSADIALFQLQRGTVTPQQVSGEIRWQADGGPAETERSQQRQLLALPAPHDGVADLDGPSAVSPG